MEDSALQFRIQDGDRSEVFGRRREIRPEAEERTFGDMVTDAINSVDDAKKTADQNVEDFVSGKTENVHDVMLSLEKADISFQLMLEIRNRVVEAYQELSRMQI